MIIAIEYLQIEELKAFLREQAEDAFPDLKDEDYCPCSSGKKYRDCCKNDPEGVKHVVYEFRPGLRK